MEGFKIMCALFFIVVSFTTIEVLAEDDSPLGCITDKEDFEKCLKKLGITKEQVMESMDAYRTTQDASKSKDAMCLAKCVVEETGVLSSSGELNMAKVKEQIPAKLESAKDEIVKCLEKIAKISTCEDMAALFKCIPKKN